MPCVKDVISSSSCQNQLSQACDFVFLIQLLRFQVLYFHTKQQQVYKLFVKLMNEQMNK